MKFTSVTKLKTWAKMKGEETQTPPEIIMRTYMMERFLERISLSQYKDNFILKGGFLIASMVGLDMRSTMDMDTTIKGIFINEEILKGIVDEIMSIDAHDGITFELLSAKPIRDISEYDDFNFSIRCWFEKLRQDIRIDITIGNLILPSEITHDYQLLFENRTIQVKAYNLYTVLAEKIDAILSNNIHNTRTRDYYDIYLLVGLYKERIDRKKFSEILQVKMNEKNHNVYLDNQKLYVQKISEHTPIINMWEEYTKIYGFAKNITFTDVLVSLNWLLQN